MTIVNITPPGKKIPPEQFSLFALGFRPFFMLAAISAIVLIGGWLLILRGGDGGRDYYPLTYWHSHEMVFGFSVAVLAGFLLTAVRNWTSAHTLTGAPLALLAVLWLAARVLAFTPIPQWLLVLVDLAFLPTLALALLVPIIKSNKKPQLIFIAILLMIFVANLLVHLSLLGMVEFDADFGTQLGLNCVLLTIVIMAGRVMPFFIERGAPGSTPNKWPWLERLAIGGMLIYIALTLFMPASMLLTFVAAGVGIVHGIRLAGWISTPVWRVPLLWVLVLGYGWLVIGFVMTALAGLELATGSIAIHAYAASIAVLSLGMMARVALGHTGRELKLASVMGSAFALLNFAMLLRVFGPLLMTNVLVIFMLSGILWVAAFSIYAYVYWPILSRARVDGQPG